MANLLTFGCNDIKVADIGKVTGVHNQVIGKESHSEVIIVGEVTGKLKR